MLTDMKAIVVDWDLVQKIARPGFKPANHILNDASNQDSSTCLSAF